MRTRTFAAGARRRAAEAWRVLVRPRGSIPPFAEAHEATPVSEPRQEEEPARLVRCPRPPVPEGRDLDALTAAMRTVSIDGSTPGELASYADDAMWRFLHTLDLVGSSTGTALELGANPYFITWLLREHTDLDLTLANYFGKPNGSYEQTVRLTADGAEQEFTARYDHFNLEHDRFPYPDDNFDVVIYCEIIEHLTVDPVRVLREIHRVLKPGGTLVLTTPNVDRLGNVVAMIEGRNIYDPYSGHGPYGRHNREYNPHELSLLLRHTGFSIDRLFTADAHHEGAYDTSIAAAVTSLLLHRQNDLGQYVFLKATASGTPSPQLPSFLYRSYDADEIIKCE